MEPDRQPDIAALDATLTTVERVLDVEGLRNRIDKLEHEASDPNLWDDQSRAQKVTSELSHAQGELRRVEHLRAAWMTYRCSTSWQPRSRGRSAQMR